MNAPVRWDEARLAAIVMLMYVEWKKIGSQLTENEEVQGKTPSSKGEI
jgi:hypothetical protein